MLVGLIADTHNQLIRTETAVDLLRHRGAEVLIHCGDMTGPELAKILTVLPCYAVLGNNDVAFGDAIKETLTKSGGVFLGTGGVVTLQGKKVAITHGDDKRFVSRLLAASPDYLISGHSHIRHDKKVGKTRLINPGALHRAKEHSVGLLDLDADRLEFLNVECSSLPSSANGKRTPGVLSE